jgi:hypothetical protein
MKCANFPCAQTRGVGLSIAVLLTAAVLARPSAMSSPVCGRTVIFLRFICRVLAGLIPLDEMRFAP